jgi:hypothetical protein
VLVLAVMVHRLKFAPMAHRLSQPLPIVWVLQALIINLGVHLRVGGGKRQDSGANRQFYPAPNPEYARCIVQWMRRGWRDLQVVARRGAYGGAAQAHLIAWRLRVHGESIGRLCMHRRRGMVAQVVTNTGDSAHHWNPVGAQMGRWPQAREQQQVR